MIRLLLILFIVLLNNTLWAQPEALLHQSYAERFPYVDSVRMKIYDMDSATAMQTIDKLAGWAKQHKNKELYYQFSFLKLEVFSYDFKRNGEDIAYAQQVDAALDKGYRFVAADGYHRLSVRYWKAGDRTLGMEYGLKAYDIYKNAGVHEFPMRVDYQHKVALKYYIFHAYHKAKYYLLDLENADTTDLYHILGGGKYNTLALVYRELKQTDSAIYFFRQIYNNEMQPGGEPGFAAVAAGNLGGIYYAEKEYDTALYWLWKDQELKHVKKEQWPTAGDAWTYSLIAGIYLQKGQVQKANIYADSALWMNNLIQSENYSFLYSFYRLYAGIKAKSGDMRNAYGYLDSALKYKDSVTTHYDRGKMQEAERKIEEARHELELANLQHMRQKSIWVRNFLIALVSFLLVVALLIINRERQRVKKKQALLEKEQAETKAELLLFTTQMHEKNALLAELQEQVQHLSSEQDVAEKHELIAQLQQSTILTDEEWEDFRRLFEKVHTGYINRVKEKFPDITPAEIRYMVLVKLNMSNKEMANVLGISSSTVRNYKHRMTKKFDLNEGDDLEQMIKNM